MKLRFYITILFLVSVIYPCFSQEKVKRYIEETAELNIETSFNIRQSRYHYIRDISRTCCDTITTLTLKNTNRKAIEFYIDNKQSLISVFVNGEDTNIVKSYNYITIPIYKNNVEIKITTRKSNLDVLASKIKGENNEEEGYFNVNSPFPDIKLNKINWTIYSSNDLWFTGTKLSHYSKELQTIQLKSSINSEKIKYGDELKQTHSKNRSIIYQNRKIVNIILILCVIIFTFLHGLKYIRNFFCWPFALLKCFQTGGSGFTCIELLIVIAIIGILASMAQPNICGRRGRKPPEIPPAFQCYRIQDEISIKEIKHYTELNTYNCPELGIYKMENEKIYCSIHGSAEIFEVFKKTLGKDYKKLDERHLYQYLKEELEYDYNGYKNKLLSDQLVPYQIELEKSDNFYTIELANYTHITKPLNLRLEYITLNKSFIYNICYIVLFVLIFICPFLFSGIVDYFLKSPEEKNREKWNKR